MTEYPSDEWKKKIDETIREIRRDLYLGNGRPGLTYRVASTEGDIKGLKEREENRMKKQNRIELAVWTAVAIAIVNLLITHLH